MFLFNIHNVTELTLYLKNAVDTCYGSLAPSNHYDNSVIYITTLKI